MNEKSARTTPFYRLTSPSRSAFQDGAEAFESLPTTAGPWSPDSQHGGPPAALLARAIEGLSDARIGRFTMELLGPVPDGPLAVSASVLRSGRSVQLLGAELRDVARDRVAATARAWMFPRSGGPGGATEPPPHGPADGVVH